MKSHILFICIAIITFPLMVTGQTVTLTGRITGTDNDPITGVNIYTRKPLQGTTTNADGVFNFTFRKQNNLYVYFSAIGYQTDSIKLITQTNNLHVQLQPDTYPLSEVVIMPDSALLALLRKSYSRISKNYPVTPIRYDGFYRETAKGRACEYLYFSEAMLDVFKNSYSRPRDPGQVEIVKSRRIILPGKDSIFSNLYFYGGAFCSIDGDFVLKRADFINPSKFKNYKYTLAGINKYDGRDVYVIEIVPQQKDTTSFTARLFIDSESLAYIKLERTWNRISQANPRIERRNAYSEVSYIFYQNRWYLKYFRGRQIVQNSHTKKQFDLINEFVTTQIHTDSVKSIPYNKRLSYGDPFLLKTTDYNPDFWDGYTILEQDKALSSDVNMLITALSKKSKQPQPSNKWIDFILRFYWGIGITYQPISSIDGNYRFNYTPAGHTQNLTLEQNNEKQNAYLGLNITLGIHLTKNWNLFWYNNSNNKNVRFSDNQIGVEYRFNIKSKGYPLFIGNSLTYGWNHHHVALGTLKHSLSSFKANGKTFDVDELDVSAGIKQTSLCPGMSLFKSINNSWGIELSVKYHFQVSQRYVATIKEKEGSFLSRKTATLPGDVIQVVSSSGENVDKYITVAPFQVGLILKFR